MVGLEHGRSILATTQWRGALPQSATRSAVCIFDNVPSLKRFVSNTSSGSACCCTDKLSSPDPDEYQVPKAFNRAKPCGRLPALSHCHSLAPQLHWPCVTYVLWESWTLVQTGRDVLGLFTFPHTNFAKLAGMQVVCIRLTVTMEFLVLHLWV